MGTRSSIGMEHPDGSVTAIYCHWDGYLSHNGVIIHESYQDMDKLIELLDLGDISFLGAEIGTKHDFDNPPTNTVNAYGRDRGEDGVAPKTYGNRDEWLAGCGQEYNYLLTMDGEWLVDVGGFGEAKFVNLEDALRKENVIK